ncbi:ankyrin repeat-containing domain protein, partial [Tricladium varicosporioides]
MGYSKLIDPNAQTIPHNDFQGNFLKLADLDCREGIAGIQQTIRCLCFTSGRSALHLAARNGNIENLRALLADKRIDMNLQDGQGQTPLHKAAKKGHLNCVKALVDAGVDPCQKIGC